MTATVAISFVQDAIQHTVSPSKGFLSVSPFVWPFVWPLDAVVAAFGFGWHDPDEKLARTLPNEEERRSAF
jgi:hypothetical protein